MKKLLVILIACLMPICLIAGLGDVNKKNQGIERLWDDFFTKYYVVFEGDLDDDYSDFSSYRNSVISLFVAKTNPLIRKFLIKRRLLLGYKNTQHPQKGSNLYSWSSCAEITILKL